MGSHIEPSDRAALPLPTVAGGMGRSPRARVPQPLMPTGRDVRVLATGFGPFPGMPINPSAVLVQRLLRLTPDNSGQGGTGGLGRVRLAIATVPTEWDRIEPSLRQLYAAHQPDYVFHFGVSRRATGIRIETRARNAMADIPDQAGLLPRRPIIARDMPATLATQLPVARLSAFLHRHGHRAEVSRDCGLYICNALYFHALRLTRHRATQVGFFHIPVPEPFDAGAPLQAWRRPTLDAMVETVADLIGYCTHRREPSPAMMTVSRATPSLDRPMVRSLRGPLFA